MNTPKKLMVERGFKTNSWFFKQFSYLFVNPLWTTRLPAGFSVCPYFWLSLFSFFIFKPFFVWPIAYVLRPIMKLLGKPATKMDQWLAKKLYFMLDGDFVGRGFVSALFAAFMLGFTGLCLCIIGWGIYNFFSIMQPTKGGLAFFLSVITGIPMSLIVLFYEAKNSSTECKPRYYVYVWGAIFLGIILLTLPKETIDVFTAIGGGIWNGMCIAGSVLWGAIGEGVRCLGIAFAAVGKFLWAVVCFAPLGFAGIGLSWVAMFFILGVLGWILDRCMQYQDNYSYTTAIQENPSEILRRNRKHWGDTICSAIYSGEYWKKGLVFNNDGRFGFITRPSEDSNKTRYVDTEYNDTIQACYDMRAIILRRAVDICFSAQLDVLQNHRCDCGWKKFTASEASTRLDDLLKTTNMTSVMESFGPGMGWDRHELCESLIKACRIPEIMSEIKQRVKFIQDDRKWKLEEEKRRLKRLEQNKTSWSHLTCIKITGAIGNFVENSLNGIGKLFCKIWSMTKAFFINIGVLIAYLWTLLKAKKQGVCPYVRFEYVNEQPPIKNNTLSS